MTDTTMTAKIALEWWRAAGPRTKERLLSLVAFWAQTRNELDQLEFHQQSAIAAVRNWEWF